MKKSFYNFEFPFQEGSSQTIFYNSRTNALALLEAENYTQYKAFCEDGTAITDEKFLKDLTYGGFLVDDEIDELALIRFSLLQSRFGNRHLGLTIAPTSDCNFRCIYCYEKDSLRKSTMTEEVQNSLIDYVKRVAPIISDISVSWYGGEPLLALDIIERLTGEIRAICEENKIEYRASIVTNGYLLTPKVAQKLGELHISNIQITLDGLPEQHDKRRPLKGGQPTFSKIISNLKESKDDLPCRVSIRVNVDKQNISQVDAIIKILEENGLNDAAFAYLGMVENSNGTYEDSECFHTQEFSEYDYEFKVRNNISRMNCYPRLVHNVCSADSVSGIVVDSDGLIYKCWNDIGIKERAIGDLLDGSYRNQKVSLDYLLYDPTEDEECKMCKYLPICMGGCPHMRQFSPENRCNRLRYTMEKYISDIAQQMRATRQAEKAELQTGQEQA
jgi:uncharacterized protein